jgi:thioredoxin reductase (NADPH)
MSVPTDRLADGTIVLDSPAALPEVLDLLIVGGGPVGTACAFHAKELGIRALVIESDDLMKRIRDYAKDKPILPDYGGGDTMPFPAGGDLVSALQFAPIDKDEMVVAWKGLYRRFSVPAKVGVELLSLSRQADGTWSAAARNHYTKKDETYRARNVVLGLGRGVPRRLDISGNVQDLAVRLTDAEQYVGAPACVIGGGTSAAEAAIAISNAKTASETDETPVYWSYRGKYLPKVSPRRRWRRNSSKSS